MKLSGKTALVTGGNSGIGLGIAHKLNDEGAKGIIVGRNEQTLVTASQALSGNFTPIQCDVTNQEQLDSLFSKTQQQLGKLDILVVNAGGAVGPGSIQPFDQFDESSFDAMTALNFKSVFFTVQKALPYLNDNASIILVASIALHKGFPGMSVYAGCKAAVRSLAKTLSAELMPRGIRVNVVSPGTIDTPVFEKLGLPTDEVEKLKAQFTDQIPVGRIGMPSDIGNAVAFLASSESSFIIGEEIVVDGGVVNL
ncbi:MAG: glucose 1-dehydrogenase [Methyloprofundus sp.]|nr:glucose 1-dehydrogenase [Methyloprofundus sp.]